MSSITKPWTLLANISLAVNPKDEYVKIEDVATKEIFILVENAIPLLQSMKQKRKFKILQKMKGKKLENLKYIPPFNYYQQVIS